MIETVTASVEENAEKEEEEEKQKKANIENSDSIKDANKDSFIDLNASIDETKVADEQSKVEEVEEESKKVVDENTHDDDANRESFISVQPVSVECVESADNQENKATSNVVEEEHSSKEPFVDVIGLKEGLEDAQKSPTEEPFEEVKVEEEEEVEPEEDPILDILGNSSLIKKILKKGAKDQRPKNGQICSISYTTRLEDKIIEDKSSYQFILGDADVVPGNCSFSTSF